MTTIHLNNFRNDLLKAFPDIPEIAALPILSANDEEILLTEIAEVWEKAKIPKQYPAPSRFSIVRENAAQWLSNARGRVIFELRQLQAKERVPVASVMGGADTSDGTPPEYTGPTFKSARPSMAQRFSGDVSHAADKIKRDGQEETLRSELAAIDTTTRNLEDAYHQSQERLRLINIHVAGDLNIGIGDEGGSQYDRTTSHISLLAAVISLIAVLSAPTQANPTYPSGQGGAGGQAQTTESAPVQTPTQPKTDVQKIQSCLKPSSDAIRVIVTDPSIGLKFLEKPEKGAKTVPGVSGIARGYEGWLVEQRGQFAKVKFDIEGETKTGWVLAFDQLSTQTGKKAICYLKRKE